MKMRESKRNILTQEQKQFILDNYANMNNNEISKILKINR